MDSRPVVVAPDKFKGTFSSDQVAAAIADGLAQIGVEADICPVADGGEGTIEAVAAGGPIELIAAEAVDALGRPIDARFALLDGGRTALVQSSDAIGLDLIAAADRDPIAASSTGVGMLIAAAAATAPRDILVGVGGTASTDGGRGALEHLRERRLLGKTGRLKGLPRITALCDVRAAWEQAPTVFAPQKGADPDQVAELVIRLDEYADELPQDPRGKLMTGAGGGLAGGLWSATGATLRSGAGYVLERLDFDERMRRSRAVITGEGSLDRQTLLGKAVGEVATRARQAGVPCFVMAGELRMSEFDRRILDFETSAEAQTLEAIVAASSALGSRLATA